MTTTEPEPPAKRRSGLRRWLRTGMVLVAVGLGVAAIASQWSGFSEALGNMHPMPVLASGVLVLAAMLASMLAWRVLLADLGSPLPLPVAARVFFVSQLGKYVPGKVWMFVAQVELGREHNVPARRSAVVGMLTLMLTVATGLIVPLAILPFLDVAAFARFWWAFLFVPVLLVLLHPKLLNPLIRLAFKLIRKQPPEEPLTFGGIARSVFWMLVCWGFYGLHLWVLIRDLGATEAKAVPLAIAAFALSWTIGFLVLITPAGAGAREAALVVVLGQVMVQPVALLAALVSRALLTIADLVLAGGGVLASKRHQQKVQATQEPEPANRH
jgi:glycosyltransferase 2 family protein